MNETTHRMPAAKAPKRWKRSSPTMKAPAVAQRMIQLALMIWAVRDIRRRRDDEINGNRKVWTLAAFAPPIGPIAYFLFGRKRNAQKDDPLSSSDSAQQIDVTPI